jgi:ComF family protein
LKDGPVPARRLLEGLLAGLLPADCLLCAEVLPWRQRGGVCLPCWDHIPWAPGLRLSSGGPLRAVLWAADYDGEVRRLIQAFKFAGMETLGPSLAVAAAARIRPFLQSGPLRPDLTIAVPLHWRRRLRRGYNQAEVLARVVSREMSLPLARGLLGRPRAGGRQLGRGRRERLRAMDGLFHARRTRSFRLPGRGPGPSLHGRTVLLVDDVMTTGATLEACAAALRAAGAAAVAGFVVARTP